MLFFFEEVLAFDGVATAGSDSASGSVATSGSASCGADGSSYPAGGSATAEVGIGGSDGSLGFDLLSMIKAKHRSSSMLVS